MASLPATWLYQDIGLRGLVPVDGLLVGKSCFQHFQTSSVCSFPAGRVQVNIGLNGNPSEKRYCLVYPVKCEKKGDSSFDPLSVEQPPYDVYFDSTSGQLEPASGARANIPTKEYWPEGTASRVRAARAAPPTGVSEGEPSYGKNPGSRRKMNRTQAKADSDSLEQPSVESFDPEALEMSDDVLEESKDILSDYVVYQTESEEKEITDYDLDKKFGRPHPFIDPKVRRPIEDRLSNEELWWNWRKPEKEQWSRWQKRKPDVETVFLKAMAETGQIKLYGDIPTLTETALYRARRHLFKEERLQAEEERLQRIGPIAYYSEWVEAWKRDTSREAVQKHFEETGEDENTQLMTMFQCQTAREYRIMMGTDIRIKRDPLAMRMREDQIKEIWGGDPVYPTVNYIQDPNEKIDYRGPDFHEPTSSMLSYLLEHKKMISREELKELLAKEKTQDRELADMDEAMARAVDIGEDEGEDGEAETENEVDEKITRNWSVLKSTPELRRSKLCASCLDEPLDESDKIKWKVKKIKSHGSSRELVLPFVTRLDNTTTKEHFTLEEAVEDSENLTDFLLDFDEEE